MHQLIKVTQIMRVEKSTIISVEAESSAAAIALLASGEIDIPSADDDVGRAWQLERSSVEHEDYWPI